VKKIIFNSILGFFENIFNSVPEDQKILFSLIIYTFLILMYAVFIWKFYKFLARRDIIQLNLRQYEYSVHPGWEKTLAVGLYTLEYLIILPFLVLFWFAIFSIFLLVLSESQDTQQILMISAAIISSTRITSYISEELSKDVAKILPFTVLAAFILGSSFFNSSSLFDKFAEIPNLFTHILIFLIFIFIIEFLFRAMFSVVQLVLSKDSDEIGDAPEK
jgi:hypothetical protein